MLDLHIGFSRFNLNIQFFEKLSSKGRFRTFVSFYFTAGKLPETALMQMIGAAGDKNLLMMPIDYNGGNDMDTVYWHGQHLYLGTVFGVNTHIFIG